MKLYVKAKSKKAVNELLKSGAKVNGVEYNMFNPNGYATYHTLNELPTGTTVAIFEKTSGGSPVAKSWGTYNSDKNILK